MNSQISSVAKEVLKNIRNIPGFAKQMSKVNIVTLDNGRCVGEFTVEEYMTNAYGTLHGAYVSLLLDNLTSYALATHPKANNAGVSITMQTEYFKSAPLDSKLIADATVTRVGRTLAFTEMKLCFKDTNELIAKGSHIKFVGEKS